MVRHQLPLHGARTDEGSAVSRSPRASRSRNIEEAKALGYQTRPVLVGPVTFLKLAKSKDAGFDPLSLLDRLLPVYIEVLRELAYRGAEWVQIDEPCLVLDLDIVGAAGAASRLYGNRQGGAAAQDHAGDLFWRARRQSRYRAGAARRRPASRSGARAGTDRRPRRLSGRIACCRSASSTAATSGARI